MKKCVKNKLWYKIKFQCKTFWEKTLVLCSSTSCRKKKSNLHFIFPSRWPSIDQEIVCLEAKILVIEIFYGNWVILFLMMDEVASGKQGRLLCIMCLVMDRVVPLKYGFWVITVPYINGFVNEVENSFSFIFCLRHTWFYKVKCSEF